MPKKYSNEFIRDLLVERGYKILGEIKSAQTKVLCETEDGYKVLVSPAGIIRRNDCADIFSKYNPYTIENIHKWIKNHEYTCTLLSTDYVDSKTKLEFRCECGSIHWATLNDFRSGKRYCNFCAKSKRFDGKVDYNGLVVQECKKRGYELLPDQDIRRSGDRFKYICIKHRDYGIQESYPDNFITDYNTGGCYQCGIEKRALEKRMDEKYCKQIAEKCGMIYCGLEYTPGKKTRILYKCPKHLSKGVQVATAHNMEHNKGNCPYCMGRFRTKEELQFILDEMDMEVTILEYDKFSEPMKVRCNICGAEWIANGIYLTQGSKSCKCSRSRFEILVGSVLDRHGINYCEQYRFDDCRDIGMLPFDFYIKDKNIAIEVDGEGHYQPIRWSSNMTDEDALDNLKDVQRRDEIKTNYCLENNIHLIRIPYWEKDNVEDFLIRKIDKISAA